MSRQRGFIVATLYVALAAGVAGALGGAAVTRLYYLHQADQRLQEARQEADAASEVERERGRLYEAWKAAHQPKTVAATRRIEHAIEEHRDWADGALPVSVRQSLEQAARDSGATEPDAAVPAVPGAASDHQR